MNQEESIRLPILVHKRWFEKIIAELDLITSIHHNGERGRECEEVVKNFLKDYIPDKFTIASGFVYTESSISNQCDIMIYDSFNYPVLFSGYANKIIYHESLKANIECSTLLSKDKIKNDNLKFTNLQNAFNRDEKLKSTLNYKAPLKVLFTYKSNISSKEKVLEILNDLEEKNIDMLFCAQYGLFLKSENKYISFLNDDNFHGETEHDFNLSLEEQAFQIFLAQLLERLDSEYEYEKLGLTMKFMRAANHVDYKE